MTSSLGTSNTSSYSSFVGHGHLLDMTNSIITDEFNFSLLISEKGGNLSRQESQNPERLIIKLCDTRK